MADLSLSVTVSRAELALGDLELESPGTYSIIRGTLGPGAISWRKQVVTSPYVHGQTVVNAVKDVGSVPLGVRVYGSTTSQLHSRVATLLRPFEQFTYVLTMNLDGSVWQWRCESADYAVGDQGVIQDFHLRSLMQEVTFTIPRHPTPLAGPT